MVCADCRTVLEADAMVCPKCGWMARQGSHFVEWLSSKDRNSADFADYVLTYDTLADRFLTRSHEAMSYVDSLAAGCVAQLPPLRGKAICDVGSGRGFFIKHALAAGAASVTAVDVASPALATVVAEHGVKGYLANAENLPFDRCFDILVATDIVEHVLNVPNFLVSANWALKDKGLLLVRVPYLEDMMGYSNFFGLPMHFTHLRTYDRTLLVHDLETAGYKIEKIYFDGFRADYPARFWKHFPGLRDRLQKWLQTRYGLDNVKGMPELLARLLMKPIEIGAIARKVKHIEPIRYHDDLREFHDQRKARSAPEARS
jgi:SAM-dependent methyltransferase